MKLGDLMLHALGGCPCGTPASAPGPAAPPPAAVAPTVPQPVFVAPPARVGLIPATSQAYRRGQLHDGIRLALDDMGARARGSPFEAVPKGSSSLKTPPPPTRPATLAAAAQAARREKAR